MKKLVFGILLALSTQVYAFDFEEGVVLVKTHKGVSEEKLNTVLIDINAVKEKEYKYSKIQKIKVQAGQEASTVLKLKNKKEIEFAELNYFVPPTDEPLQYNQWHLPKTQAVEAWNISQGEGIKVAICDTGVYYNHPDLAENIELGINTVDNSTDVTDIQGHGTLVSGTVAAAINGIGIASFAPKATILAMRISNDPAGYAYFSDMAECVAYARTHGARVANISYGGAPNSSSVASEARNFENIGGVVVVAAGNDNSNPGYFPYDEIFVAAATSSSDVRASFSNYGNFVDVAAPGVSIYTTNRSGSYSNASGTSFASPSTAGVVAVAMAANPALSSKEIRAVVSQSADDLGDPGYDIYYGAGRINSYKAALLAKDSIALDTTPPTVNMSNPINNSVIKDTVLIQVEAQDQSGISSVDYYIDGIKVDSVTAESTPSTYIYYWDTTLESEGVHSLYAVATDVYNNSAETRGISVTVDNIIDPTPEPKPNKGWGKGGKPKSK